MSELRNQILGVEVAMESDVESRLLTAAYNLPWDQRAGDLVEFVVATFADPRFLRARYAHEFLSVLEIEWFFGEIRLGAHDIDRIVQAMVAAWDRFVDPLATHYLSVILGEHIVSGSALEALAMARGSVEPERREHAAHGLQHFAAVCSDPRLAARALAELDAMADDPIEAIRENAVWYAEAARRRQPF